jgi:CAAX prenyl protease-like protein
MSPILRKWQNDKTLAHVAPFALFMLLLLPDQLLEIFGFTVRNPEYPWYRFAPEQWLLPLQTVICLALLIFFWKQYDFRPVRGLGIAVLAAVIGIAIWILPGHLYVSQEMEAGTFWSYFGFAERKEGFNPSFIEDHSLFWYWMAVVFRFLRMVVVVALIEEIFWRGFLMRFLLRMDGNYWKVPFGQFHWLTLVVVTGLFVGIHGPDDRFAALIYGLLTYAVAVRTKSLAACVVMHATANLLLGIYTMSTGQWGYW